ncbi:hypothetical protein BC835DRAFT_431479 [Cytidiella melzeri]|nr:hypothetical protein BC835DRAFT_431479 [Cytidiella melzeri]
MGLCGVIAYCAGILRLLQHCGMCIVRDCCSTTRSSHRQFSSTHAAANINSPTVSSRLSTQLEQEKHTSWYCDMICQAATSQVRVASVPWRDFSRLSVCLLRPTFRSASSVLVFVLAPLVVGTALQVITAVELYCQVLSVSLNTL